MKNRVFFFHRESCVHFPYSFFIHRDFFIMRIVFIGIVGNAGKWKICPSEVGNVGNPKGYPSFIFHRASLSTIRNGCYDPSSESEAVV